MGPITKCGNKPVCPEQGHECTISQKSGPWKEYDFLVMIANGNEMLSVCYTSPFPIKHTYTHTRAQTHIFSCIHV